MNAPTAIRTKKGKMKTVNALRNAKIGFLCRRNKTKEEMPAPMPLPKTKPSNTSQPACGYLDSKKSKTNLLMIGHVITAITAINTRQRIFTILVTDKLLICLNRNKTNQIPNEIISKLTMDAVTRLVGYGWENMITTNPTRPRPETVPQMAPV